MKIPLVMLAIFVALISPMFLQNSYACSCASPADFPTALQESQYAFIGTVSDIDNSGGQQKIIFHVTHTFKGDLKDSNFVLRNLGVGFSDDHEEALISSCDVGYQIGVTYSVFVYDNDHYNNGMCDTKPIGFLGLGLLNPFEYNLFYYVAFGITIGLVAGITLWRKRK